MRHPERVGRAIERRDRGPAALGRGDANGGVGARCDRVSDVAEHVEVLGAGGVGEARLQVDAVAGDERVDRRALGRPGQQRRGEAAGDHALGHLDLAAQQLLDLELAGHRQGALARSRGAGHDRAPRRWWALTRSQAS